MYYVYCYFNPVKTSALHECGFEPFYVGKGKNDRLIYHLFESHLKADPNKLKVNTIRKIRSVGQEPLVLILSEFENEKDAFAYESSLIHRWGRRDLNQGPLSNMTDGGEGTSNKIYTSEYRKKLSEATKKAMAEGKLDSNISAFSKSRLGVKASPDTIAKRVASRKGYTHSDETRAKLSVAQRAVRLTPEWKEKASLAQKGKKHSPEHIAKMSANNPRSTPIEVFGAAYPSMNSAAKKLKMTPRKIQREMSFKFL